MTTSESRSISLLRLPLALAIVYIHTLDLLPVPQYGPLEISWQYAYTFVFGFITFIITSAVPLFFLISGFLFFQKVREWDLSLYSEKLCKRVRTLLVPYVSWTLIEILFVLLGFLYGILANGESWSGIVEWYHSQGGLIHLFWDCREFGANRVDWLGFSAPMCMPINMPLWFLRDLMVVVIFTPILYWMGRKAPKISLLVLFVCYVSKVWIHLPGFSPEATFYFFLGALFALYDWDFVCRTRQVSAWMPWLWVGAILFLMYGQYGLTPILRDIAGKVCTLLGVITMLVLAGRCVERRNLEIPETLTRSVFFIFVAHGTHLFIRYSPLTLVNRLLTGIILGDSPIGHLLLLFLVPLFTLVLCEMLDTILLKFCPKVRSFLVGSR